MANPIVKSGIPQQANLAFALWVSPDVVGGPGAWDAKNSVAYPAFGTLNSVALGTSGKNGLVSTATNCGVALGEENNHTGTAYDFADNTWTILALVRPVSPSGSAVILQNRDAWSPNRGYEFAHSSTFLEGSITYDVGQVAATTGSGYAVANQAMALALVVDTSAAKTYKNGTLASTLATTGTSINYASTATRLAGLFNTAQAKGQSAVPLEIYAVIGWNVALTATEIQAFGTTEAALLAGDFYTAAFDFGEGTAPGGTGTSTGSGSGGVAAGQVAGAGAADGGVGTSTGSGSGGVATGGAAGTGSFTSDAMENNTGAGLLASVAVLWTLYYGQIGAAPSQMVHGTGTTNASGVLTGSGHPAGVADLWVRTPDGTGVCYHRVTVA